jgi:8-oxo-dGTP diphosphatase
MVPSSKECAGTTRADDMPDTDTPTDKIYLVRHAKAGKREEWKGDDALRPLSPAGRRQAALLADTFAPLPPGRLLSSPYVRCVETLEPTADRVGTQVERVPALAEGRSYEDVLELIAGAPANSVLCSHGDVIPAVMAALERRGATIRTPPDWRKGSTWVLQREPGGDITSAECWPPPA